MNQLPIVILSKQLKYSLAQQKIKTLEKAIQLLPKLGQNDENKKKSIEKLANKYYEVKNNVEKEFNRNFGRKIKQNIKGQHNLQTIRMPLKIKTMPILFSNFFHSKCICQVYGPKGSGKTCLLLHIAEQFASTNKLNINNTRIVILNCVSGITPKRIQKLMSYKESGMQIECLQVPTMQQIISILSKIKEQLLVAQQKNIFIGIDMMISLLMAKQKMRIYLTRVFQLLVEIIEKHEGIAVFTNLVQHKYELGNEELYNHSSYNCQSIAEHLTQKIYLERPDKASLGRFKMTNMKGKKMEAFFQIGVEGIKQVQLCSNQ